MLKTERVHVEEAYKITKLISVVNPLTPNTIKQIMQKHQKSKDCFYKELNKVI